MSNNVLDSDSQVIFDGYKKTAEIPMASGMHRYRFEVNMPQGLEKTIRIDFSREGHTSLELYIAFDKHVEKQQGRYSRKISATNKIILHPGDSDFHRKGTYYLLVVPKPTFIEQFFAKDATYPYSIKFELEGSFEWLDQHRPTGISLSTGRQRMFRYIIEDKDHDHQLFVISNFGQPVVKTSFSLDEANSVSTENSDSPVASSGNSQ